MQSFAKAKANITSRTTTTTKTTPHSATLSERGVRRM
jgi:hypothetical protein